jgi:uroporphyrinogen-III synthase
LRRLVDGGCRFYAIGPQTAETLVKLGIPVNAVADHGGGDGLVDAALKDLR